jgi:hypothetical protein
MRGCKLDLTVIVLGTLGLALTSAFSYRILTKIDALRTRESH